MRKIFFFFLLLLSFTAFSQKITSVNTYGFEFRRFVADSLFGLPADTFSVPAAYRTIPWLAIKGTTLYGWNTSGFYWQSVGGGGGSTNTSIGSGFKIAVNSTNNIKSVFGGNGITLDSSTNSNGITFKFGSSSQNGTSFSSNRYINTNGDSLFLTSGTTKMWFGADSSIAGGAAFIELKGPYGGAINFRSDTAARTYNGLSWYKKGLFRGTIGHDIDSAGNTNHLFFDDSHDANGFKFYAFEFGGTSSLAIANTGVTYMGLYGSKRVGIGLGTNQVGANFHVKGTSILGTDSTYLFSRIGSTSDSVYTKRSDGTLGAIAQSSIISNNLMASNGIQVSGTNVILGNTISQATALTLSSNPIQIVKNGLSKGTLTDSSTLLLANYQTAATTTDSMTSPGIVFYFNGRKTSGGASSVPVSFRIDAYGKLANPSGGGILELSTNKNNTGYTVLQSIDATGSWQQNFIIQGRYFGGSPAGTGTRIGTGSTALQFEDVTATQNLVVGSGLDSVTTGSYNTAVGFNSPLKRVKAGDNYNTGIGYQALQNCDTSLNTAVGAFSSSVTTTGYANSSLGANSMLSNTTGIKNTAIGAGALENNTTGSFNTGIGEDNTLHLTTGNDNVGVGWLANSGNYTGSKNIGVGNSSLRGITNGNSIIAVGHESGYLGYDGINHMKDSATHIILLGSNNWAPASNYMVLGDDSISHVKMYGIVRATDTTGLDLLAFKRSDSTFYNIPSNLVGGSGGSGLTVGTTTITSGTNTRILYDNSGVLGEYSVTGSGTTAVLSTTPTFTTRITSPIVNGSASADGTLTLQGNNAGASNTSTAANIIAKVGNTPTQALDILNNGMVRIGSSPASTSGFGLYVDQPDDGTDLKGIRVNANNHTAQLDIGYDKIQTSGALKVGTSSGGVQLYGASGASVNISTSAAVPTSTLTVDGSFGAKYVSKSATYSITATDFSIEATSGTFTATLPTAASITGRIYFITNSGSGVLTLATTSSQTFVNQSGTPTTITLNQFGGVMVQSNGANWIVLSKF